MTMLPIHYSLHSITNVWWESAFVARDCLRVSYGWLLFSHICWTLFIGLFDSRLIWLMIPPASCLLRSWFRFTFLDLEICAGMFSWQLFWKSVFLLCSLPSDCSENFMEELISQEALRVVLGEGCCLASEPLLVVCIPHGYRVHIASFFSELHAHVESFAFLFPGGISCKFYL